jgi:7,8-dihydropterin-6-yl-methyl-4-(beta-D-ribofuranosyl)aminobenzene 5'-phosphate synthase
MKVTVLVENTRLEHRSDLQAEHGLSLHIERQGQQILFDTGASEAFNRNAERLGVDLAAVDLAVISHHHYDHSGGLAQFLKTNSRAKVYLRSHDATDVYFRAFGGLLKRSIGLDRRLLQAYSDRFEFVDQPTEIAADLFILTEIGEPYPQPKGNRYLFVEKEGKHSADSFDHELVMVLRQEDGLVVFTGCSHRGILNMVDAVSRQFEGIPIKAVFGGFHLVSIPILNLMAGSKAEVEEIGREMLRYPIAMTYTGHCTGAKAYGVLKGVMGDKLSYVPTGSSIAV